METQHEYYMARCLELAKAGEGKVAPNPMVGSVIVRKGKIIGEGYHRQWGGPHAEVHAIASVQHADWLKESVLYVNLEPCAHHGKTPPCADLIVEKGIPEVVIGTSDPFALVAGKGIEKLRQGGCKVRVGVLEQDCLELNRRFFTFHREKRPYVFLKWAETADGFVDIDRQSEQFGQPTWITSEMARIVVHKQRAMEQAILVGTETALTDNPALTLRDWFGKAPLRIVADRFGRLDGQCHLLDGSVPTLVLTTLPDYPHRGTHIDRVILDESEDLIDRLMSELYRRGIQSLIVEGGPALLQSFIDRNLWDEAHVYIGQLSFRQGVKAPDFKASPVAYDRFYNSELRVYRNR